MSAEKKASKASPREARTPEGNGGAELLESGAFLERLEASWRAWADRGEDENRVPAVGWLVLDDRRGHWERLGLGGLLRLEQAIQKRVLARLGPGDLATAAPELATAVLLSPDQGDRDLRQWAADTARAVNGELFDWEDRAVAATLSSGLCPFADGLSKAEQALLEAARVAESISTRGGNRSKVHRPEKPVADERAGTILKHLLEALRTDKLTVVYQPLFSVKDDSNQLYQMLPRMVSADGKLITASEFVPHAKARGVLPALDRWMFSRALRVLAERSEEDADFRIFLIQSPALIDDPKFSSWVAEQLAPAPRLAEKLVLEFGIGDLQLRLKQARTALAELRKQGLEICIGGVHEAVPEELLLEHLPADYLRMAAGFVKRLLAHQSVSHRYEQFVPRARAAERRIIVPMLEDAESVARIWQMDVDLIQGNFIQEPREQPDA